MNPEHPKILPWLARKAGVPLPRAGELWQVAAAASARAGHPPETPEYWRAAVDGLIEELAAESLQRRSAPFGLGPLVRLPARQWLHGLALQETLVTLAANSARDWRRACS